MKQARTFAEALTLICPECDDIIEDDGGSQLITSNSRFTAPEITGWPPAPQFHASKGAAWCSHCRTLSRIPKNAAIEWH